MLVFINYYIFVFFILFFVFRDQTVKQNVPAILTSQTMSISPLFAH